MIRQLLKIVDSAKAQLAAFDEDDVSYDDRFQYLEWVLKQIEDEILGQL